MRVQSMGHSISIVYRRSGVVSDGIAPVLLPCTGGLGGVTLSTCLAKPKNGSQEFLFSSSLQWGNNRHFLGVPGKVGLIGFTMVGEDIF